MIWFKRGFILFAMSLEMILYEVLQRTIGLNSVAVRGFAVLGMREIKEELISFSM